MFEERLVERDGHGGTVFHTSTQGPYLTRDDRPCPYERHLDAHARPDPDRDTDAA